MSKRPDRDGFYWYFPSAIDENEMVDEPTIVLIYEHSDHGMTVSLEGGQFLLSLFTGEFSDRLTPMDAQVLAELRADKDRLELEVENIRSHLKATADDNLELIADLEHANEQIALGSGSINPA